MIFTVVEVSINFAVWNTECHDNQHTVKILALVKQYSIHRKQTGQDQTHSWCRKGKFCFIAYEPRTDSVCMGVYASWFLSSINNGI